MNFELKQQLQKSKTKAFDIFNDFVGKPNFEYNSKYSKSPILDAFLIIFLTCLFCIRFWYLFSTGGFNDFISKFWFLEGLCILGNLFLQSFNNFMRGLPKLVKEEKLKEAEIKKRLSKLYRLNRKAIVVLIFVNSFLFIKAFNLDVLFFDFYKEFLHDATISFLEKAKKLTAWVLTILATVIINTTYGVLGNFAYSRIQKEREKRKEKK